MSVLIPRNTSIPSKKEETYYTVVDNQKAMGVKCFEGERKFASENHQIGDFKLTDLDPKPAGQAKMVVRFEIDSNSILTVTAFDVENE